MRSIGIIPARYASTRFPGKPLADILGKPMIQRVYEQSKKCSGLNEVIIATDDERILSAAENFGARAIMTDSNLPSGTERCMACLEKLDESYDIIVNIQGDEPYISPNQLDLLLDCFKDPKTEIASLVKQITNNEELFDPNRPKVILDKNQFGIYFSRQTIPYIKDYPKEEWLSVHPFFKHIGLYAYRSSTLKEIVKDPTGQLEKSESLEQLRWIENGYKIKLAITQEEAQAVDTPEDLQKLIADKSHLS